MPVLDVYDYLQNGDAPLIISVPHCGTEIPEEVADRMFPEKLSGRDDTDWFVDELYSFASALHVNMIRARYHRWVIDLNRDPASAPLYHDGRLITGIVPLQDFRGEDLYASSPPDKMEIASRIQRYYNPYHDRLKLELKRLKKIHSKVLLFDAHSIRSYVPSIYDNEFPEMILGDNEGLSASEGYSTTVLRILSEENCDIRHNYIFKGGYITRNYGNPGKGIHALQLEMSKSLYMDASETKMDPAKKRVLSKKLEKVILGLLEELDK